MTHSCAIGNLFSLSVISGAAVIAGVFNISVEITKNSNILTELILTTFQYCSDKMFIRKFLPGLTVKIN